MAAMPPFASQGVKRKLDALGAYHDAAAAGETDNSCDHWARARLGKRHDAPGVRRVQDDDSSATSSRSSSTSPTKLARDRPFDPAASIALVGMRGCGKSTLAVIAAAAMKRRVVVDTEQKFAEVTGQSTAAFKRARGAAAYHSRQREVLSALLAEHGRHAVIVSSWMDRGVASLFEGFAASRHPVIHVLRDVGGIQEHLMKGTAAATAASDGRLRGVVEYAATTFRGVCNFEFYNISESVARSSRPSPARSPSGRGHGHDGQGLGNGNENGVGGVNGNGNGPGGINGHARRSPAASYLSLKRAERHFLKFMSLVTPQGIPFGESAFPLAAIPTEHRRFTYAMAIPLSRVLRGDGAGLEDMETGADAVELVIDGCFGGSGGGGGGDGETPTLAESGTLDDISRAVGLIRRNSVIPIIYHVPWPCSSSSSSSGESQQQQQQQGYVELVRHGLRLCPEYITLDLRLEDRLFSEVTGMERVSKIIGAVHYEGHGAAVPAWEDPVWAAHYRRAQDSCCELFRATRPAERIEDNFAVQRFRSAVESIEGPALPLIAYNTGSKGRTSACFNPILTSVLPHWPSESSPSLSSSLPSSAFDVDRHAPDAYAQPSLTAHQAALALQASFVVDPLKLYVLGSNVGYSMSPAMHNAGLRACGLPHVYTAVSTDSLSGIRDLIHDPSFGGASLGLPFKVEAISLTHSLSSHARAIGAVNTLIPIRRGDIWMGVDDNDSDKVEEEGGSGSGSTPESARFFNLRNRAGPVVALHGENTDWVGIRASLRSGLSPANAVRPGSSGLVIGAGGMARAAVYSMLQLGVQHIAIFNRTAARADELVQHFTRLLDNDDVPLLSRPAVTAGGGGGDDDSNKETTTTTTTTTTATTFFHVLRSRDEPWPAYDGFRPPTMIVSCIPTHSIGEAPAPDFTLPKAWLQSPTGGVVVEYGYKEVNTPLLEQIRAAAHRGWVAKDGLDLLPEQGYAQFELFTGRRAPRRLMGSTVGAL